MNDAQLRTILLQRREKRAAAPLAESMALFMQKTLAPRVRSVGRLASAWDELVPRKLAEHTVIESFRGGTLRVAVDSPAVRYKLQSLLRGGLLRQLQAKSKTPLNRVVTIPGQFYETDPITGEPRYHI